MNLMPPRSTLIRNARIFDGSGDPSFVGDLELADGWITRVGSPREPLPTVAGAEVIDATSWAISPGFIDMHSHADLALLEGHDRISALTQGVTTELIGQDGLSYAPAGGLTQRRIAEQIAGWNGPPLPTTHLPDDVETLLKGVDRRDTNVAYLVPHGTLRASVLGWDDREATARELARMRELLSEGLIQGAMGLSAGLTYAPGAFASTSELIELCAVVARHGGFFAPHHRSYGRGAIQAYAECVEIARRSGVSLHLTHAHLSFDENAGRAGELIDLIDSAVAEGLDISFDTYPYAAGSSYLHSVISTARQQAGLGELSQQLRDPRHRAAIGAELATGTDGSHGLPVNWDRIVVSSSTNESALGRSIAELAASRPPIEVFAQLLIDDEFTTMCVVHEGQESNVRALMRHPKHLGGSDGLLTGGRPHPRAFGTFARYLGRYCRELGVLELADMIRHLTANAATRLGLTDRGRIAPGFRADLLLFDPAEIRDTATYEEPRSPAVGIHAVWVNGELALTGSRPTHVRAGGALVRGSGDPHGS